jgi:hypothetical protein
MCPYCPYSVSETMWGAVQKYLLLIYIGEKGMTSMFIGFKIEKMSRMFLSRPVIECLRLSASFC